MSDALIHSDLAPPRKKPAHGVFMLEGQPTIVFLTVCTPNRETWLASKPVQEALESVWSKAAAWLVGRYVLMPDHIHLFAGMTESDIPFDNWVRFWKSQLTKNHKAVARKLQTDHWDTRIRSEGHYEEKWEYVRQNPVRAGLVANEDEWPYQGELFELPWR
ncbi:MAG: hypothetical protein K2W96_18770 [Gemmataceae bacterium]|nr:hypothetical protein [Gemmataceae bacterium]